MAYGSGLKQHSLRATTLLSSLLITWIRWCLVFSQLISGTHLIPVISSEQGKERIGKKPAGCRP